MDWTIFWTNFLDHLLNHFFWTILSGGEWSIASALREGWDAVYQYWGRVGRQYYYSGRGEKGTITTRGGVGGGCNSKLFWLMELLLDRTNYFNRFSDRLFVCQNFCAGPRRFFIFLPLQHWTSIFIENIAFTILHCWVMRVPFESTCAPSVASHFPLCIHYVITKSMYLPFVIDLIGRDNGISVP